MTATTDPAREDLVRRVREVLPSTNVREVRMFGAISFMVDERLAVAAGKGGDLLVCVDPGDYDDHLAAGAEPAVMGKDRPMGTGWVKVPNDRLHDDQLARWVAIGTAGRS